MYVHSREILLSKFGVGGGLGYILFVLNLVDPWSVTVVRDCYLGVSLLKLCWFLIVFWRSDLYRYRFVPVYFLHYVVM